jgi:hypothetical protein
MRRERECLVATANQNLEAYRAEARKREEALEAYRTAAREWDETLAVAAENLEVVELPRKSATRNPLSHEPTSRRIRQLTGSIISLLAGFVGSHYRF